MRSKARRLSSWVLATMGLCLLTLVALFSDGCSVTPQQLAAPPPDSLRVATYNVHYIVLNKQSGSWSVADWERRKGPLDTAFKTLDADIIAFQEMESFSHDKDDGTNLTLDWLLANNDGHAAAAVGDWRTFPSTQPIFYRPDRLTLRNEGWFFFSDTPDVIYSRTFNGSWPAFASWALFHDGATGNMLRVVNVHFEYKNASNRRLSTELVVQRTAPWIAAGESVLLAGDLNARLGSDIVASLFDAGFAFAPVDGSTYHFNRGLNVFGAIDHLASTHGLSAASVPVVLRNRFDGEWPTDHYPVVVDYRFE